MKRFKRPISEVAKGLFHQGSGDSKPLVPNLGVNSKKAEGDSPLNMNSPAKGVFEDRQKEINNMSPEQRAKIKEMTDKFTGKSNNDDVKKVETNKNQSSSTKKDPYAEAAKKDSKLGDYVKQRKGLKKGTPEYAKVQNKINAAYGVKKRYDEGKADTKVDLTKATVSGKGDDNVKTRGKNQNASKVNDSEKRSNKDVAKSEKRAKVNVAKADLNKTKKDNKVEKINAKAEVAAAKGKTKKADRLKARAERKATGKSKKDQGRNIFGRKTKKQKAKEAAAATDKKAAPTKKALVGKQENLPPEIKAKIKAAPGKYGKKHK